MTLGRVERATGLLLVLATLISVAHAQPARTVAPNSPLSVICGQSDLSQFCTLIRNSLNDPVIGQLATSNFVGTIFAPTNKGLSNTDNRIKNALGVGIENLSRNPQDAANLIKNHIIIGQALSSPQLTNGLKLKTAYGNTIQIDKGFLYGTYVKGESNTVTVTGTRDLLAGQAYIHEVDGAIVPRTKSSGGLFGK